MKRLTTLLALGALAATLSAQPYKDRSLSPEERAADLVSRLTLEEKASLSMHTSAPVPALGVRAYNWWSEALHGVARNGSATVFPQPIGMAASFDEPLLYEVFTAVSDEARVKNRQAREAGHVKQYQGVTFWTPNINIFRDPRWGRGMETYGEDPYLTGQLGMAVVRGLQGPSDSPVLKTHACAKHYAVHSGPEWNRHSYDANVSERDLRETYLPAFKDLVTKADVQEVMTAYNRFRGEPCGASSYLIDTILRGEWGYKGLITSDCWAVEDFYVDGRHGYSPDVASAAAAAVHAGVDTECGQAYRHIPEAVERGLLDEKDLDRNLIRLFAARFRLGEMDDISLWDDLPESIVEGPEHLALSRKMAQETMVLLQNKGNILPLKPGTRIALVGPNGDDAEMQWGNYNPIPKNTVTLLGALKERIPDITYVRGCGILGAEFAPKPDPNNPLSRTIGMSDEELQAIAQQYAIGVQDIRNYVRRQERMQAGFLPELDVDAVLKELEGIEVVVFAGGISPRLEGEEMPVDLPGFKGGDRTDIQLPQVQRDLLKALHDAGKKVILVNFSGCAIGLEPETQSCDAILQAWYPGQEGGHAIADVLFGDVVPSGKLPVTFYRNVEQLPDFENYDMKGHTYRFFEGNPLYPFGYGLSYTQFRYKRAKVRNNTLIIPVKNTGKREAAEVVQVYVRRKDDPAGPSKTLRAFRRVTIPAGKTVKVTIPLEDETFLWWSEEAQDMVPLPGKYELLYGGSSDAVKKVRYKFTNK
ncbi:MAG: glycoside hydrolase family 3 C-terminal domain-containing protein [Bacteroidales bacterium]|nr:glycoside hydrolase family 3 C-terminal domain-containing protein [Bacteroidales bacterium]